MNCTYSGLGLALYVILPTLSLSFLLPFVEGFLKNPFLVPARNMILAFLPMQLNNFPRGKIFSNPWLVLIFVTMGTTMQKFLFLDQVG